tara:strand:- start:235 stop:1197 length:963 start_codon:yes stop_codon:yes gene_type:complete
MAQNSKISVVVPVLNENESINELYSRILNSLSGFRYEVIFVDDGSTDDTNQTIRDIIGKDSNVKLINFQRNYGKAVALSEAFKIVSGEIVITIDGDLQDDPSEFKNLIYKINENWDLVSGWKKVRKDSFFKILASKVFNLITRYKTGINIHDFNCGLKAYKLNVVKSIKLYGHLHRFIPVLAHNAGFKVTEIPVKHHPRLHGKSKYGKSRFFHGFYDFLTIILLDKYLTRPMHFFGKFGILFSISGTMINSYLSSQWFLYQLYDSGEFTVIRPLFFLGILLTVIGVQFFSIGLIGEMIIRKSPIESPQNIKIFKNTKSNN